MSAPISRMALRRWMIAALGGVLLLVAADALRTHQGLREANQARLITGAPEEDCPPLMHDGSISAVHTLKRLRDAVRHGASDETRVLAESLAAHYSSINPAFASRAMRVAQAKNSRELTAGWSEMESYLANPVPPEPRQPRVSVP